MSGAKAKTGTRPKMAAPENAAPKSAAPVAGAGATTWRFATVDDAPTIARIYNQGISERVATFETDLRGAEQIVALLVEKGTRYPTVVVERAGAIVAWASGSRYRARRCYEGIADHSVYVDEAARGTGAGRAALQALVKVYEARGFWKLVSRIFPENKASLALHAACGFREIGLYRRHGKVDGVWRDCVIVERLMGEAAGDQASYAPVTGSKRVGSRPKGRVAGERARER